MRILLLLSLLLLLAAATLAAPAEISFTLPEKIVSDVPFTIAVDVDARQIPFTEFDLLFMSDGQKVTFLSHSPNYFTVHPLTGAYSGGYRYYTTATGTTSTSTGQLFTLQSKATSGPVRITLDSAKGQTITASIGYDALVVGGTPSEQKQVSRSTCGDGVVGYFDTNTNGIKDVTEPVEACDADEGCHNCAYIEVGYKGTNCVFGSTQCAVAKMAPRELLKERLNALLDAQCYPQAQHPQKEFCADGNFEIDYTAFDARQKINFISKVAAALRSFFAETAVTS